MRPPSPTSIYIISISIYLCMYVNDIKVNYGRESRKHPCGEPVYVAVYEPKPACRVVSCPSYLGLLLLVGHHYFPLVSHQPHVSRNLSFFSFCPFNQFLNIP